MNQIMMLHIHIVSDWPVTNMLLLILMPSLLKSSMLVVASLGDPHYMSFNCQQNLSYDSGSVFESNLNYTLFTRFPADANGFSNFTKGTLDDQVYALFYCKGDVDAITCRACVVAATRKIFDACKFWKEGVVWFEECTLRYANRNIFSTSEESPYDLYYNYTGIVTENHLDPYKQIFDSTMDALIIEAAYSEGTLEGFAIKQVNLSSSELLQVLAQCTPDIVGRPCYKCLRAAIRVRDTWANTVVSLPSCLIRYDLYRIVLPLSPISGHPPPLKGFHIAIIVVIPVVIGLLVIGGYLCRRYLKGQNVPNCPGEEGLPKFSYSKLQKMTKNFTSKLGSGACGVVYHGRLKRSSTEVAVKLLKESDGLTQFNNEIKVFGQIRHENIVSLLGYCEDKTKLALVCEFMNKGDLKDFLSGPPSSWSVRLQIALDTAKGLCYLHDDCDPPIVHRDVKPANILLHQTNEILQAKVADFGYSKIFPENLTTVVTRVIYTPGYAAPEYLTSGLLNKKVDVYSFGVVLIQLITGKVPSSSDDVVEIFQNNLNVRNIEIILDSRLCKDVNHDSVWKAAEVAESCVNSDAAERPEMSHIVTQLQQSLNMELQKIPGSSLVADTILGSQEAQEHPRSYSTASASNVRDQGVLFQGIIT